VCVGERGGEQWRENVKRREGPRGSVRGFGIASDDGIFQNARKLILQTREG